MIRECPVFINNEFVTVVRFGEENVQLPAINREAEFIKVSCEDGHYAIVEEATESIVEESVEQPQKKKKTTKQKNVEMATDENA